MEQKKSPATRTPLSQGNIVALLKQRRDSRMKHSVPERLIARVTASLSTVWSVYIHLALIGGWLLTAWGMVPFRQFDPELRILAIVVGLESIFITSFVLIAQKRLQDLAEVRANLTLHISLLEERENTRLMHLVTRISQKLGLEVESDSELAELMADVDSEAILKQIEESDSRGS